MCGIWLLITNSHTTDAQLLSFNKLKHRGPTDSKMMNITHYTSGQIINYHIGFHRLAIHDLSDNGMQPFTLEDDTRVIYVICNGEIYNHNKLRQEFDNVQFKSSSDCEVL